MKAIILAAGMGTRMKQFTADIPKCLLKIDGESVIERQVGLLRRYGIEDVTVVVGYLHKEVMKVLGDSVSYVMNDEYSTTNSSYSLYLARNRLHDGWLHMNCDLVCSPGILERVIGYDANAIVIDTALKPDDDQEKVRVENGRIVEMSKTMPFNLAYGKTIGMAIFRKDGASAVLGYLDKVIKSGERNRWFFSIIADVLDSVGFVPVTTAGEPWAELDTPEDLKNARIIMGDGEFGENTGTIT